MQRRTLLAGFGAPAFHFGNGTRTAYQAIAAEQMPAYLECVATVAVLEVRQFKGTRRRAQELEDLLAANGVEVISRAGLTFMLGFDSMEARGTAWANLTVDSRWPKLRDSAAFNTSEIRVYLKS